MAAAIAINEPSTYMTLEQVLHHSTLGPTTWWAEVNAGRAPQPRKLSGGRSGWLRAEFEAWAESRPVSDLLPPANSGKGATREARAARAARAAATEGSGAAAAAAA